MRSIRMDGPDHHENSAHQIGRVLLDGPGQEQLRDHVLVYSPRRHSRAAVLHVILHARVALAARRPITAGTLKEIQAAS